MTEAHTEKQFTPPYIYTGLYEYEELMRQPDCDSHVKAWRQNEHLKAVAHREVREVETRRELAASLALTPMLTFDSVETATGRALAREEATRRRREEEEEKERTVGYPPNRRIIPIPCDCDGCAPPFRR